MMKENQEQKQIAQWFNQMYKTRGAFYLRPKAAYAVFKKLIPNTGSTRLLDIACGIGRLLENFDGDVKELHGIDISQVAVEEARKKLPNAQIICGNAENLPYPSQYFDVICCIGSLERFIDLQTALSEQKRVSVQDARFCFMVRNSMTWSWHVKSFLGVQNRKGHQGAKNLEEWSAIFKEAGFDILQIYPDPWPYNRWFWWLSFHGFFDWPYSKLRVASKSLKYANEFIFILKKKADE